MNLVGFITDDLPIGFIEYTWGLEPGKNLSFDVVSTTFLFYYLFFFI